MDQEPMDQEPSWPPVDLLPLTRLWNDDGSIPECEAEQADAAARLFFDLPNDATVINPLVENYQQRMAAARQASLERHRRYRSKGLTNDAPETRR